MQWLHSPACPPARCPPACPAYRLSMLRLQPFPPNLDPPIHPTLPTAGKLVVDEALREYSVNSEVLKTGANADAASPLAPYTRAQRRRMDALVDATYATFKKVGGKRTRS